ncbi:hypothetical protein TCAL_05535 [Tigriopus californicus]|uniref:CSD domain-containing protein n=1 Tax=Tigriopus californicus TaxID=6832 RepID=A0A553P8J7_TIGCA|nr:cold shock domain-containing protein E1-like isoform X1 [Tigriopus californicus]TRY73990.1 hypothetical protein TCAL_05535 [Tigriopus californicus]
MNQWTPLPPSVDSSQSHGGYGHAGGPSGFSGRPQSARPITKNPQSMFQNFPGNNPSASNNMMGRDNGGLMMRGNNGGGGGGGGGGSGGSPGSSTNSFGNGRFNSLGSNGYDGPTNGGGLNGFTTSLGRMETRTSPNFSNGFGSMNGGGGGVSGSSLFGNNGGSNHHVGNAFSDLIGSGRGSNGFENYTDRFTDRPNKTFEPPPMNRPHLMNGFDRSMSSNGGFDGFRGGVGANSHSSNGSAMMSNSGGMGVGNSSFDRQLSAPSSSSRDFMNGQSSMMGGGSRMLGQMGGSNGSVGGSNFMNGTRSGGSGVGGNYVGRHSPSLDMFGGSGSMMTNGSSGMGGGMGGAMNDMKIGTWNDAPTNSSPQNMGNFPQVSNFEIGTFNAGGSASNNGFSSNSGNNSFSQSGTNITGGPGIRETGIIEKLLHSYGFIQCCDRQARLFFHFSQFDGNIEHLKIGDPVEFEMTYDRRTGKPIASSVSKIAPDVVMREERVIGLVTTEAALDPETGQELHGRISYENRGECFFLPFTRSDVEGNVTVTSDDKVSFQMATMARSGNLVARTIRLEDPASPVKYQGVVNSITEDHGLIERADVVREIRFHLQDMKDGFPAAKLGDDVEFIIQTRNGKEVASAIEILPRGTVVFEDVGAEYFKGQVLKPCDKSGFVSGGHSEDALSGRVKYRGPDRSEEEIQFAEKDQVGDFTLRHGDWVKFVIAIDRRDKLKRATKIELLEESFKVSDERREHGTIEILKEKEKVGVIKCADRDGQMAFKFCEILDVQRNISVGDEVAFTVAEDDEAPGKKVALRIRHLIPGSVKFHVVLESGANGVISSEPASRSGSPANGDEPSRPSGTILYEHNGMKVEVPFHVDGCNPRQMPRLGDTVQFDIIQLKATKATMAAEIKVLESKHKGPLTPLTPMATPIIRKEVPQQQIQSQQPTMEVCYGFIAALKDGFGFLETSSHDKEVFFHFSNVEGKAEKLEVGMEVSYLVYNREKGGKLSAECVKVVDKGTLSPLISQETVLQGSVVRPLRSVNPDQDEYCGEIHVYSDDGKTIQRFQFSIASLANKKDLLQVNDPVQLQPCLKDPHFASNVKCTREKQRAFVEAMKGSFGFLSYEVEGGKKLFFHTCEVDNNEMLQQGDEVEFVVVSNKRTGKHSAVAVRKISTCKRPERLISKLKTLTLHGGMKIMVIRQPKGPENGMGFKAPRNITN